MSKKRVNIKDVTIEEFYQLPKVFFWNKTYREELSHGAKLLYMLIRDRFSLSIYTTKEAVAAGSEAPAYVDEHGDIYCILDNGEIEFTLNCTSKTVIKFMNELIDLELVASEPVEGGANRIYLNTLDSSGDTLARFLGERDYSKHVASRKKKKKQPSKTLEECIAAQEERMRQKQSKKEGSNISTPGDGENTPPRDGNITPPGDGEIPPLGEEKLHPNKNYVSDLDFNQTYPNQNNASVTKSSSSLDVDKASYIVDDQVEEEEDENSIKRGLIYLGYELAQRKIFRSNDQIDKVLKQIAERKLYPFTELDVELAINLYKDECSKQKIAKPVVFFANGFEMTLDKQYSRNVGADIRKAREKAQTLDLTTKVPFYNWLEQ